MSNAIRRAREAAGLSQTQLTQRTGIAPAMISRLETGQTNINDARIRTIRAIADALGTTIDALAAEDTGGTDNGKSDR